MRKMKRVLSVLVCVTLLMGLLPTTAQAYLPWLRYIDLMTTDLENEYYKFGYFYPDGSFTLGMNDYGVVLASDWGPCYNVIRLPQWAGGKYLSDRERKIPYQKDTAVAVPDSSLTVKMTPSFVYNGRYVKLTYEVKNTGSAPQEFQLGTCVDDAGYGLKDSFPTSTNCYSNPIGYSEGNVLTMGDGGGHGRQVNVIAPSCDTTWRGFCTFLEEEWFTDNRNYDCKKDKNSMAWSWKDEVVGPGETWSRFVLIGVGDLKAVPPMLNNDSALVAGSTGTLTGTAQAGNVVYVNFLGMEYQGKVNSQGKFTINDVAVPADYEPSTVDVSAWAVDPDGFMSTVKVTSVKVSHAPAIVLSPTETTVVEDTSQVKNDSWYKAFIQESTGTVSFAKIAADAPGKETVTYTAKLGGFPDATANLTVNVLPKPAQLAQTTVSGSGPFTLSSRLEYTGGLTYTETGFVYGAIQNPTLDMNDGKITTTTVNTKNKSFSATVAKAKLAEGITYYARAYAKTADGTVIYGLQSVGFGLGVPSYGVFKITNNSGSSESYGTSDTFTITRTGGTDGEQTVYYRTVNGSAVGGTHFKHVNGTVTFAAGETSKTVTVEEYSVTAPYNNVVTTRYSNGHRSYRLEIYRVEGGATINPDYRSAIRIMTLDSDYEIDEAIYVNKVNYRSGPDFANNGQSTRFEAWKNQWGDGQPDFRTADFKETLYGNNDTIKAYFDATGDYIGYYLTMNVYENYDCYGYINFIDSKNHWQTIVFDIDQTGGDWLWQSRFPFTSNQSGITFVKHDNDDPNIPLIEEGNTIRLPLSETSLQIRCKADKKNGSNIGWFGNRLVDHARIIDLEEPQLIGIAPMAGGMYFPGDPVTISLVFNEIVDRDNSNLSSSSFITTNWGNFYYTGGVDTNVLYFTGTMPETTSGTINLTKLDCAADIKDMCDDVGTASSGTGSTTVTVGSVGKPTVSVGTISNTNGTLTAKITATNAAKLEYVWSKSSTAPAAGWQMLANKTNPTVTTRQTSGKWYLYVRATNSDGRVVYADAKSVTIPTTGTGALVLPELTLKVDNDSWAKTRTITVTRKPSDATVKVKAPGSTTATTVSGSSYTATANGTYTFTLTTSNGETVVQQAAVSKLDLTGPAVTFDELDNVRTFVEPVILTVRAEDGESGLRSSSPLTGTWQKTGSTTTYTATFTKVGDGVYTTASPTGQAGTWTLSVTATDAVGNTRTATSKAYTVDLSEPTIKTTLKSQSKTGYVYSYTVTKGGSDIETIVLPDGTITDDTSGTLTLAEPGTYYVLATDKVGHVAQSAGMTVPENQEIDGVAPSVRLSGTGESDWIKGPAVVEVEIREAGSTPTAKRADTGENIPLTKKVVNGRTFDDLYVGSFSVAENGNYSVTAVDKNGNEGEAMIGVDVIDPDAPTIGAPTGNPTEWTAQNATISFTATDEASGVKTVTVKKGNTAVAVTGGDGSWSFTAASNGTYTITVADAVGNTATETVEVTRIDNAAPDLAITGGDVGGASLELTVAASSAGSGMTTTVSKDGGAAEPLSGETYTVTAAGTYTFTATSGTGLTTTKTVHVYTVAFDSQGGGTIDSQLVVNSGRVSKPADPSRGFWFTFTGWKNGESVWNFETSRVTGDMTLVAQWEEVSHTYDLEVTAPVFEAVRYGYARPAAKAITITSTGNTAADISDVTLSGKDADRFTLAGSGTSVAPGGNLKSYTLQPDGGLGVGTYTATVTVTYHGGETAADTVTFTVNKALPKVTAPAANKLTYNGSAQALVKAGSAVGGEMQYSLDGVTYSTDIPTETDAGDHTVYYKVVGQDNYEDVEPVPVPVTIAHKNITGTVTVSGTAAMAQTLTAAYTPGDPAETVGYQWYRGSTAIEGATGSSYTIVAGDVGSSIQVKVSGTGNYTGTVSSRATAQVTPARISVTAWPAASAITYGQTLGDSALTGGVADMDGTFTWADETIQPAVSDSGTTEYGVIFTPAAAGYSAVTGKVTLTVNKATPVVTVTAAGGLTYTGSAQALMTGSTTGGRLQYSLNGGDYAAAVPTGTAAGSYTVSYKVVGGDNYNDVAERSVNVAIAKAGNSITGFTCGDIIHGETPKPTAAAGFGEIVYTYSRTEDGEYAPWSGDSQSGTWYVKASVAGTGNYAGAEEIISFKETAQREDTPAARIDYTGETLTGLTPGTDYIIIPAGGEAVTVTADENGVIPIEEEWLGKTLSVATKARDENFSNSLPQSLSIPARPAVPAAPKAVAETIRGKSDGEITGINSAMEYRLEGGDWQAGPGVLDQLPGGTTVIIRSKATGSAFAGETRSLTIGVGRTLTVIFNTQGGSLVSPITGLSYENTATRPADPARSGYTFAGWYTEAGCVTPWSFENKLTDNVTLYAKWEKIVAKRYTVTFDAQGGEPVPAAQTVTEGKLAVKPTPSPAKDGYDFVGWFAGENGTTPWQFGVDTVSGDTTLLARWEAKGGTGDVVKPGETTTTNDGTKVEGKEDGSVVVTPPGGGGGGTTTITPGKDGDVTVDPDTGEVTVPGGSTVDLGNGTKIELPDGGKVDGDGNITLPDGGTVTAPDGEGGSTTITAPDGGGTIKTTEDGGLELPGGSTVKTENGPEITVPDGGGKVDEGGNVTVPGGSTVTIPDGEGGKTEITVPDSGEGTITPTEDGKVEVPGGSTVKPGDGNGPEVTVPDGGKVDGQGGVTVPGGSDVTITDGKGNETTVTVPDGGEGTITPAEDGKMEIPSGSTVKSENGPEITVGDQGGKVDDSGGVTIPGGGSATISDGNGGETEITIPSGGEGTITPTDGGKVEIPSGSAVKSENGPKITVGEQGGTVDDSGEVTLPGGGTATIPDGSGGKTEITVPDAGGDVKPTGDGKVEVPEGTAITTGDGVTITVDEGTGTVAPDGTVTIPGGGTVTVTTPDGKSQTIEVPADGTVDPDDYYRPTPGPSIGGGAYPPTVRQPENGKVTVSPSQPNPGNKVIITVTPEDGYVVDTITVTDRDGKPIEVTKNGDVTYGFIQPAGRVTISATMKLSSAACPKDSTCPIYAFTDASTTAWYHDGVHYCLENGLMEGYGGGIFAPDAALTRGMLAEILYNEAGRPAVFGSSPFEDVAPDAWYARAVAWAAAQGVVDGYGNGRFGPEDPITREQLAAMLWRYARLKGDDVSVGEKVNLLDYKDFDRISQWAAPAMQWAVGSGVVEGIGNGILNPTGNATRAEAATMLQRFCEMR